MRKREILDLDLIGEDPSKHERFLNPFRTRPTRERGGAPPQLNAYWEGVPLPLFYIVGGRGCG